jgi:hypothetical protein
MPRVTTREDQEAVQATFVASYDALRDIKDELLGAKTVNDRKSAAESFVKQMVRPRGSQVIVWLTLPL